MIFLDDAGLRALTGFAQKEKQVAQLRAMGVAFWLSRGGRPVVALAALDGSKRQAPKEPARWSPAVVR